MRLHSLGNQPSNDTVSPRKMHYADLGTDAEKEYLSGLEALREKLANVQLEVRGCEKERHLYASEDGWMESEYKLNSCLEFLASKNLKLACLDGESKMLTMLNDLRATGADQSLISFATDFWEGFDGVMELIDSVRNNYHIQVLTKLLLMFNHQMIFPAESNLPLTSEYSKQIMEKMSTINKLYNRLTLLCQSYRTKVDRDLFENVPQESLLIARLPRDLILKMKILISLSNDLLNREQKFVTDMTAAMLECQKRKLEHEKKLAEKRQLQLDKINTVYLATLLLDKNKEMVQQLDKELEDLQTQLNNKENALHSTKVEMEKDQNAIEFLNHTISSTKRNQRLLAKRQHLLKTRQSLEKKVAEIKGELTRVNQAMQQKTVEKSELDKTLEHSANSHTTVSEDLNAFTQTLCEIERETKGVHSELIDIEIIHCIKTSPENLEELRDRPQSVKIAKSLRAKITRRKRQDPKLR